MIFQKKNLLLDQPAHGACSLIRKQALIQVGGYSEEISCQDGWDVWLKIINLYNVSNINLPLFFFIESMGKILPITLKNYLMQGKKFIQI